MAARAWQTRRVNKRIRMAVKWFRTHPDGAFSIAAGVIALHPDRYIYLTQHQEIHNLSDPSLPPSPST